ncbi:hypothetical protein HJA82_29340 [Rhizobium bangladeshense]|uniref:hypothetical protein n=1 Tax=Rhizobium bangladeshense TaxID=1138189 RepID=UPI001C82B1BE|nr:hypothetical protein [Rhizobium bangladeshense]MBX4911420.1 hypothetical protein [Rhizobium bangladeshense]
MSDLHPSHVTRPSDASSFDEVCTKCGATDIAGGGWGKLAEPCSAAEPQRLPTLYDEHHREIKVGDIVKVFHFVGARRKRHFMYKQVIEHRKSSTSDTVYMKFSHLTLKPDEAYYLMHCDDSLLRGYEIVQGLEANWEDRPKLKVAL